MKAKEFSIEIQNDGSAKVTHNPTGRFYTIRKGKSSYGIWNDSKCIKTARSKEAAACKAMDLLRENNF